MKQIMVPPLERSQQTIRCGAADFVLRGFTPRVALAYPTRIDPERLARALSKVLTDYTAFAGRIKLSPDALHIEPSAQGALLEIVESGESFDSLIDAANRSTGAELAPTLPIRAALSGKAPLFGARLTQLPQGSLLGLTWHHSVGDFQSAMLLFWSWSMAYRELAYDKPVEVEDRDAHLNAHVSDSPGAKSFLQVGGLRECARLALSAARPIRRALLHFSRQELLAIRDAVAGDTVTVDDALWVRIYSVVRKLRNATQPSQLLVSVNVRKRLGLPLTLIGNLMSSVSAVVDSGSDDARVALGLRSQVREFGQKHVRFNATQRFVDENPGRFARQLYMPTDFNPLRGDLFVSTVVNYPYNAMLFEPEAPVHLFGTPSDRPIWTGTAYEPPGAEAGQSDRVVSLWLPAGLARRLESAETRPLFFERSGRESTVEAAQ